MAATATQAPALATFSETHAPPPVRLGAEPKILSVSDVAVGLSELSWLASMQQAEQAILDEKIRQLKEEAEQRLQVKIGRSLKGCTERTETLIDAITAFCKAHPDQICDGKKKTRKFTHGTVALRSTKLSVELATAETTWDAVIKSIEEAGYPRFVVKTKSVDKAKLIKELDVEKIDDEVLAAVGLKRVPPRDEVNVKPSSYTVDPPAAL